VPVAPRGITKSNEAFWEVPLLVTVAVPPGLPVVTLPIAIVAALPSDPVSPRGMVKLKTLFEAVDETSSTTEDEEPAAPVVVVPTLTEAA